MVTFILVNYWEKQKHTNIQYFLTSTPWGIILQKPYFVHFA